MNWSEYMWIRNQEEPDMVLTQGNYKSFKPITNYPDLPIIPYEPITDKERDEWNEKWGAGAQTE